MELNCTASVSASLCSKSLCFCLLNQYHTPKPGLRHQPQDRQLQLLPGCLSLHGLLDDNVLSGFFFPVFSECFIVILIKLTGRVIGYIKNRNRFCLTGIALIMPASFAHPAKETRPAIISSTARLDLRIFFLPLFFSIIISPHKILNISIHSNLVCFKLKFKGSSL